MSLIKKIGLPKEGIGQFIVDGVADGYEAFALAAAALEAAPDGPVIFVARDGQRLPAIMDALAFAAPDLPVLEFPAWDCLPYDRVSPGADASARRLDAMAAMASLAKKPHRAVILTTANALLQRIPPASAIEAQTFHGRPGNQIDMNALISRLENSGFDRVATVREVGELPCAAVFWTSSRRGLQKRCGSTSSATRWNRSALSTSPPSAPPASARR